MRVAIGMALLTAPLWLMMVVAAVDEWVRARRVPPVSRRTLERYQEVE